MKKIALFFILLNMFLLSFSNTKINVISNEKLDIKILKEDAKNILYQFKNNNFEESIKTALNFDLMNYLVEYYPIPEEKTTEKVLDLVNVIYDLSDIKLNKYDIKSIDFYGYKEGEIILYSKLPNLDEIFKLTKKIKVIKIF